MSSIFNFWRFFFTDSTCWQSFVLENFTVTLSFLLVIRWHDSMLLELMLQPTFSKTWITFSSKELSSTERGIPTICRHSLLEYCALAQHYLSKSTTRCDSKLFTFFAIFTSGSNLEKLSFNLKILSNNQYYLDQFFSAATKLLKLNPFLRVYLNHLQFSYP